MLTPTHRLLVAAALVATTAFGINGCVEPDDAVDATSPAIDSSVRDATPTDARSVSVASNFAVLGEFVGYVDPERGIFEVRMVDSINDAEEIRQELVEAHQAALTSDPTGWCRAPVDRDGTAGTGAANTVEFYTPWGEIDKTIDDCLVRIGDDTLTEASFPSGVLCADVIVRSFYSADLENVYTEITSHNGSSNQYGYAFPLGTGAERPTFGRDRPGLDFGLWFYGTLTPADPEKTVVWTFKAGSTTPYTFGGRVIYSVTENCDNGVDDDCDGKIDNACGEYTVDSTCIIDEDCAGDSFCDGGALDSGAGDIDGACKCNTPTGEPYHDAACSATCDDGSKNGAEEDVDCGGPCAPCPTCTDGVQNGDEEGVDCGGTDCDACPTCTDGIKNGDEEGVDCGGSTCDACPTCTDGIKNGDEEGVDCGGSACEACPTCTDGVKNGDEEGVDCGGSTCDACPTCTDGIKNGDETGVDCGGSTCEACFLETEMLINARAAGEAAGFSVDIDGDRAVAGVPHAYDPPPFDVTPGEVYVYKRNSSTGVWGMEVELLSNLDGERAGESVAIVGSTVIAGAPGANSEDGRVLVFDHSPESWGNTQNISAPSPTSRFGAAVAADGSRLIVGAPDFNDGTMVHGRVYVYERADTTYTLTATLDPGAASEAGMEFGASVAISGDTLIVGAPTAQNGTGTSQGAAFIYRFASGSWSAPIALPLTGVHGGAEFGRSVAIDATTNLAVVGAPKQGDIDYGAVVTYSSVTAGSPVLDQLLSGTLGTDLQFGASVAFDATTLFVGSPHNTVSGTAQTGTVYSYTRSGSSWTDRTEHATSDTISASGWQYGAAVATSGGRLIVGAPGATDDSFADGGSAYIWQR